MAKAESKKQVVSLEEVVLTQAVEFEAHRLMPSRIAKSVGAP